MCRLLAKAQSIITIGALLGFSGVLMGAATDHLFGGGNHRLETALRYQQMNAIVVTVLGLALTAPHFTSSQLRRLRVSAWLFIIGTVIFCGGLYMADRIPAAVYCAPIGGFVLMAAWAKLSVVFLSWGWVGKKNAETSP